MAVQQLDVHGYRSFREVSWIPGKLNLLVGPNGSGKSNLLRLLDLIAKSANGRLADAMKRGGIVPLLWDYRAPSLDWTLRIDPVDAGRNAVRDALTMEFQLEHVRNTSSYQIALDSLGNWQVKPSTWWIYRRDSRSAVVYDQREADLVPFPDPDPNESLLPQISDPRTNPISTHCKRLMDEWRIYHDVHVERGSPMRLPATTQVAKLVDADGSNLVSVLHTLYTADRDFKRQIDEGMRAGFGEQFEELVFQPAAAQQIQLAVQWKSSSRPHAGQDLSDGTLRFLFLLTVLASPEPATLIAIDEPEVGLHPSMLPIIAEYAAEAAGRTQVVLTSHAPAFLDAFSKVGPQVTLFHWEDGQTRLFSLSPTAMEKWLAEYRLGELFTSGDLEALASPAVEAVPDFAERIKNLPPEDAALPQES
ncbi:MAG: AAA family ATPase [Gemmataceae bacterium]|nr:AAA family ATPase [Gemmataceae bacterium]MCI0739498.1 AAA family ATPase [Gemmataceae bacterium]